MLDANLPALLQSFFTTRLIAQRKVSSHTIASYRDTFRLLLQFAQKRLRKAPSQLELDNLDASFIGAFPEPASDCGSVLFPLRGTGSAGARRDHSTRPGDPQPATLPCFGGFSNPAGNRCPAGGAESGDLVGTPRSCFPPHRRANRTAPLRDDVPPSRRHFDGHWRACSLPRERAQGKMYSSDQAHRIGTQGLDAGTRQRRFQDSFPQCARRTLERRRCPAHGRSARSQGTKNLPYVGEETCLTPRASPRRGDGTFAVGRGSRGDRTLARSRIGRNHPDLFGCRPVLERTGSGQDQTHQGQGWALSAG